MLLAYQGKPGCTSPKCTRQMVNGTLSTRCFGHHCGVCDQPSGSQGHRLCPVMEPWPLGVRVVDRTGAWQGAGTIVHIDIDEHDDDKFYEVKLDEPDPVLPDGGDKVYVRESRLWREGVAMRREPKYELGTNVYLNAPPYEQGEAVAAEWYGDLDVWMYRVRFKPGETRGLIPEHHLHAAAEPFQELPAEGSDYDYGDDDDYGDPRSLIQVARDIRAARGDVKATINLSVEIADLILGRDE